MKKIIVAKTEGIAEVIDEILNEPDNAITLVIPKGSILVKSPRNFQLLKREVDSAGKSLTIESVDESVLSFAKESGLEHGHPLWNGARAGAVSDIVAEKPSMASSKSAAKHIPVRVVNDANEEE